MKFQCYDLGFRSAGEVAVVHLEGSAANIRLMQSSDLSSYKSGRRYRCYGGMARRSPVHLAIPQSGHWYLTVDLEGLRGTVRSSVSVRAPARPLPELREAPLASVPSLVREISSPDATMEDEEIFDIFISHASEDKSDVVRPLAEALRSANLVVWYDEFELTIGDSLRRKIDSGLARSRFGIVVLSPNFLRKGWTNYELDGLVTRSVNGEQVLLPIWHNITKQEVINYSPSLADKIARSTATHTIQEIAAEIARLIKGEEV